MQHITEIVPELDTMPDWAQKAFKEGNFFNVALKMVDEQKRQLDAVLNAEIRTDWTGSKVNDLDTVQAALNGEVMNDRLKEIRERHKAYTERGEPDDWLIHHDRAELLNMVDEAQKSILSCDECGGFSVQDEGKCLQCPHCKIFEQDKRIAELESLHKIEVCVGERAIDLMEEAQAKLDAMHGIFSWLLGKNGPFPYYWRKKLQEKLAELNGEEGDTGCT